MLVQDPKHEIQEQQDAANYIADPTFTIISIN